MSTFSRRFLLAVGLAVSLMAVSAPAMAQKFPAAVIAIIDSQRINRDAAAFKSARTQLDQYRSQFQGEVQKEEERLRTEEQELTRQRSILAPEAFEQRRREFERRVGEVQRKVQERQRALEQSFNSVRNTISTNVLAVINDIANERGISVVLDRVQVQFAADQLDITAEVLKRLDQRLTSVKVPPPAIQ